MTNFKEINLKNEIIVILHTPAGDVRTVFKDADRQAAWECFTSYLDDGKQASMVTETA
jgi:hypothetical protein